MGRIQGDLKQRVEAALFPPYWRKSPRTSLPHPSRLLSWKMGINFDLEGEKQTLGRKESWSHPEVLKLVN